MLPPSGRNGLRETIRAFLVALNVAMGLIALGAGFLNLRRGINTESKRALQLASLSPYLALAAFAMAIAVARHYPR